MSSSDDISLSRHFKTILNERRISFHRNATKTAIQISRLDNPSLAIMFAGLLFQYGAGNCERVLTWIFASLVSLLFSFPEGTCDNL